MLPQSAYDTILSGTIATIPNFISPALTASLRSDAKDLYDSGHFSADALAAYGTEVSPYTVDFFVFNLNNSILDDNYIKPLLSKGTFDPSKDRTVLKLNQWKRTDIGQAELRHKVLGGIAARLRTDLALNLNRPSLDKGLSTTEYGVGSTEISYTRFGPGAYLKRHIDEHHEELKGVRGWEKPTRRSISWLIYLNEDDWDPEIHGGQIRCFERRSLPSGRIGAMPNGDLQIGWLRTQAGDVRARERPVFLDGRVKDEDEKGANCAMYIITEEENGQKIPKYITKSFRPNPVLFLSGGDFFARKLLIDNPTLAPFFHFLEPPRSAADKFFAKVQTPSLPEDDEIADDIAPIGGTLVLFDSVSLPHEVLPSFGRERWATSGWYHEDQQEPHRRHID